MDSAVCDAISEALQCNIELQTGITRYLIDYYP